MIEHTIKDSFTSRTDFLQLFNQISLVALQLSKTQLSYLLLMLLTFSSVSAHIVFRITNEYSPNSKVP